MKNNTIILFLILFISCQNNKKEQLKKKLPGSSQPQDLGSISYKDTETNETSQKIQSVETTSSIVTETFEGEQNLLPNDTPDKQ